MTTSLKYIQRILTGILLITAGSTLSNAHEQEAGVVVKPVCAEKLANVPGQTLTAVTVTYAPGAKSGEHQHAGSVFAFILSGAIRSENSATGPARVYRAGESFFEPAGSKHLVSENASSIAPASLLAVFVADDAAQLTTFTASQAASLSQKELARRIFETMLKVPGNKSGYRTVHAKGLVCEGTFTPSPEAARFSSATHFQGGAVPIITRFSDGAPDPAVADNSAGAGPRGLAIRFRLPGGGETDIVTMSHNGFVVGTGEEFLALQTAIAAIDPGKPHPWQIETFLGSHPLAMKFVQENKIIPSSFANEAFFSNDAFVFVNQSDEGQPGRYQILPVAGQRDLTEEEAKGKSENFLVEDLKAHLGNRPVSYRLVVQLPNPGDPTKDPSQVWPDDRKKIVLGTISITSVVNDSATLEKSLAFDPTHLTGGIEQSDDPLSALRSRVYSLAARHRSAE
jgi:catalase